MNYRVILITIATCLSSLTYAQPSPKSIHRVLEEINTLRENGCTCGDETMPPASPLLWSNDLYKVSNKYARYMSKHNLFSHVDKSGRTVADRLKNSGYDWLKVGENLAKGYDDFYEALRAWVQSPDHCKMLMDSDVTHIGMSKHKDYWVQTFALPMSQGYTSH